MKLHGNARLTPHGRKRLVEQVLERRIARHRFPDSADFALWS
jgi:hypothetical protein